MANRLGGKMRRVNMSEPSFPNPYLKRLRSVHATKLLIELIMKTHPKNNLLHKRITLNQQGIWKGLLS